MKRVLITTDAVGGVWQYSLSLARGLIENHGCEVMVACLGEPPAASVDDLLEAGHADLTVIGARLEWMRGGLDDVEPALTKLGRLAERWGPDLVHSNQFCFGLLRTEAPVVVVAHSDVLTWMAWHRGDGGVPVPLPRDLVSYHDLVVAGLSSASAVVCPSRFMARSLHEVYGFSSRVIYNGLWPDLYHERAKEGYAVAVGRLWDEAKRVDTAAASVTGLPLELKVVGPTTGPLGETAHLPRGENIRYLGSLPWRDARETISKASFYLATASYEPFGLAALEAALSGCALLAADTPSFRELWSGVGLFFPVGDAAGLRSRLEGLLKSPAEVRQLGLAARGRALECFTADRMASQYAALYSGLWEGHRARDRSLSLSARRWQGEPPPVQDAAEFVLPSQISSTRFVTSPRRSTGLAEK